MKRLILILILSAISQKPKMAEYCSIDGKAPGVMCSYNGMSCIQMHPDICGDEGPMPSCCNASPDSADRNAVSCHCCGHK